MVLLEQILRIRETCFMSQFCDNFIEQHREMIRTTTMMMRDERHRAAR